MMLAGIGGAVAMVLISGSQLAEVKEKVNAERPDADKAYQISAQADTIIAKAEGSSGTRTSRSQCSRTIPCTRTYTST